LGENDNSINFDNGEIIDKRNYRIRKTVESRGTPGGGLIAYLKTAIPSSRLFSKVKEGKEALWLFGKTIKTSKAFELHCYVALYPLPSPQVNWFLTRHL
jgi:hypothetical protein